MSTGVWEIMTQNYQNCYPGELLRDWTFKFEKMGFDFNLFPVHTGLILMESDRKLRKRDQFAVL